MKTFLSSVLFDIVILSTKTKKSTVKKLMPLASTFKIGAKGSKKSKNENEWETLLNKNTSKLTETKTYNNTLLAALPKISAENTTHIDPTYFALSFVNMCLF